MFNRRNISMSASNPLYDNAVSADDMEREHVIDVVADNARTAPTPEEDEVTEVVPQTDANLNTAEEESAGIVSSPSRTRTSAFSSNGSSGGMAFPHMPAFLVDKEWTGTHGNHVAVRNKRSLHSRLFYPPARRGRRRRNEGLPLAQFHGIICFGLFVLLGGMLVKYLF
jgi:hypothetical protein